MIKTKFVFAVSFVAMMAVNVANAKIAATSYVDKGVATATSAASAAQTSASNAQTSADNAQTSADAAQASADAAAASAKAANDALATKENSANKSLSVTAASTDVQYPSAKAVYTYVEQVRGELNEGVAGELDDKADKSSIGTVTAANMGTTATTVVAAIKEVAGEAAAAQSTADTAKTNAAAAQSTADSALSKANAAVVANAAITAGTGTKITYDSKGLVTGSASLTAADIPTLSTSKITGLGTLATKNIATSVTSTSTDTEAPSAKAVYTYVEQVRGELNEGVAGELDDIDSSKQPKSTADLQAGTSSGGWATIPTATPAVAGLAKIGVIPSGSATSTTYATIWVE